MQSPAAQLYAEIGRRIRRLRTRPRRDGKKITQESLARALGVTRAAISSLETGKQQIYVHTLFRLADALGVPVEELIPKISVLELNPLAVGLSNQEIDNDSKERILKLLASEPRELVKR